MKSLQALLFPFSLSTAFASNHTGNSTDDDSGLSGGAVAGIVIGSLAGVTAIGVGVWYFFLRKGATGLGAASGPAMATAGKFGDNNLPMMAMRVNDNDDEL